MQEITMGELYLTGGMGIQRVLDFSMREYPGEHARAKLSGTVDVPEGGTLEILGLIQGKPVELYAQEEKGALYSGLIQRAEVREENGYHLLSLELCSGSILMDQKKKKRSFQDSSMTYGQVLCQTAEESGIEILYPAILDQTEIGFPVIQYRETNWEFIRRLASRFGFSVYPESIMRGGKAWIGLPETGAEGTLYDEGYTARRDRKFYEDGGEEAGRTRQQYLIYEVRSSQLYRVGDAVNWRGKRLFVCARTAETKGGWIEFCYILSGKDWTWQKRFGNPKISGMSLLGTVESCSGETVKLKLDIDEGRKEQVYYPWTWVPTTGNLMYMMPQKGTRVSLYFKDEEETGAIAVNCIRSGNGCAAADYRDKSLTTEHGMQLRLCQKDMGVVTLKEKVLLDDLSGIRIEGQGSFHILAAGEVKLEGKDVKVSGNTGVTIYQGEISFTKEGKVNVAQKGKVELLADEGENAIHNRGAKDIIYQAWEHGDLSNPSYRYRDEPEQKDYDWAQLGINIAAGVVVVAGATIVSGGIAGAAIGAKAGIAIGGAVAFTGGTYVASQAISDVVSGRLGDTEQYVRKALAGSVVGILTGASGLMAQGAGLGKVLAIGFGEGSLGSIASQSILNEDGEINWETVLFDGTFSAAVTGIAWGIGGGGRQRISSKRESEIEISSSDIADSKFGEFNEGLIYLPNQKVDIEYLPGAKGMKVPRRITEGEMSYLTEKYGVEFSLIYRLGPGKNGAGGQYWLYSGIENKVSVPIEADVIAIYHTHPKGSIGASDGDRNVMKALEKVGSPQRSSQIIPVGGVGAVRFNKTGTYTPIE